MAITSKLDNLVLDHVLDEEAPGYDGSGMPLRLDGGFVRGYAIPSDSTNRVLTFQGVTGKEEVFPGDTDNNLRKELNLFFAGAPLRVYRNWPAVVTAWTPTNPNGYDDVCADGDGGTYEWNDRVIGRYKFTIRGIAKNG